MKHSFVIIKWDDLAQNGIHPECSVEEFDVRVTFELTADGDVYEVVSVAEKPVKVYDKDWENLKMILEVGTIVDDMPGYNTLLDNSINDKIDEYIGRLQYEYD